MNIDAQLRKLARSSYWQNLYKASKENNGIHLFDNVSNFSGLQGRFLYWLSVYDILYDELMKFGSPYLSEKAIEDNIRCDAYLYYRKKKNEREWQKHNREKNIPKIKNKSKENLTTFNVDMRRP